MRPEKFKFLCDSDISTYVKNIRSYANPLGMFSSGAIIKKLI